MQEEVHNLAIGYHREKRDKDITKSKLDSIKGIGEEKKKLTMSRNFASRLKRSERSETRLLNNMRITWF